MFEIKGSYATAKCYATAIEDGAIEQIRAMCDQPFTKDANVRIMPDAHAGAGCTIGTTMHVSTMAVPNIVGVDIGCGMLTVDVGRGHIDLPLLDEACHAVPSGFDVWEGRKERFDLEELRCFRQLKDTKRLARSLGTLGGGNHFIEVDVASDGTNHLVIHSGSRNLGTQVASLYQHLAVDLHQGKEEYFVKRDALIAQYKAEGRRKEIQAALKMLKWETREPDAPADLCWLYGSYLDDYLHDIAVCQRFARINREVMAREICRMAGLDARDAFHTVHNYIDTDEMILRKGAIAAHEGELVLIPLNMRDGSILARGRGNADWNFSAPHGAGRLMSRTQAKEALSLSEYREQMAGVYTTSISERTLDEAPGAYKSVDDIIGPIAESVDIVEVMRPIYNFKA
ncbi:MAG: RtcB family protein [Atopobiaceae bacterium]|nr:RtcB family protein [Atopobiaceae bacterium]